MQYNDAVIYASWKNNKPPQARTRASQGFCGICNLVQRVCPAAFLFATSSFAKEYARRLSHPSTLSPISKQGQCNIPFGYTCTKLLMSQTHGLQPKWHISGHHMGTNRKEPAQTRTQVCIQAIERHYISPQAKML